MLNILTLSSTISTNDDVLKLARDGAAEGVWLRAETQTGGKGRSGRQWVSPPGNLYTSGLVRLLHSDPPAETLALVAAVALFETAIAYRPDARLMLKWPNDLLAGGAKVAGILMEREGDAVVIGIGVNLAHHPEAIDRPATSLAALGSGAPDPGEFLTDLGHNMLQWLSRWRGEGLMPVREKWLAYAHPIGTALSVDSGGGDRIEGLFDGLDADCALRLRLAGGETRIIRAGDVFLI